MLDRLKLMQQVGQFSGQLQHQLSQDLVLAQQAWAQIAAQHQLDPAITTVRTPWSLPTWDAQFPLAHTNLITNLPAAYTMIATDGSQVYPDRQMGTNCFLLNVGAVQLQYGAPSKVQLSSEPSMYHGATDLDGLSLVELVDCKRQELELERGLALMLAAQQLQKSPAQPVSVARANTPQGTELSGVSANSTPPLLFLIDGALIFWQLDHGRAARAKQLFWDKYLAVLHTFYAQQMLCAGYISLPNSKELVNLLRQQLCGTQPELLQQPKLLSFINDVHVASFYLPTGAYSVLFQHHGPLSLLYPENLRPYFVYFNTGTEIARVEFPAWIAQQPALVATIMQCIADQVQKGRGYPLCLAEAHVQAVVSSTEREFFYQLLERAGQQQGQSLTISRKLLRKKFIGV